MEERETLTDRLAVIDFEAWSAEELGKFIVGKGLPDYTELFMANNIDGSIIHRLGDNELKEIGIIKVGDRLKVEEALGSLQRATKKKEREKVLWKGQELLFSSCFDKFLLTCFGCNPVDPSRYYLHKSHLQMKRNVYRRCGPFLCSCGHSYFIDNVDLTYVNDIDVEGLPPGYCLGICCCGLTKEHVIIRLKNEVKELTLRQGEGQELARLIKAQLDIHQKMERE
eukprot:CAMPEP_0194131170 /NCGR_PEP_ID=MMETSP0152-20130528/1994_1 /TAXON_ID=1049557 /ORGANISM="Thalassiothrix antarctica, Strain L6-D1" /LENGTH=224 /DNA_ID=CAMNT_0038825861 /DNA_START=79 /DNA_END=750 /DNA_ORIENTATION=+